MQVAIDYLTSAEMDNYRVQFIVETQLLLRPYLEGRTKIHLLYKVARAENPQALFNDFKTEAQTEDRSYDAVQTDALTDVQHCLNQMDDANLDQDELNGATLLWDAAGEGHVETVCELLLRPEIDVNKARSNFHTTPLYIAAHHGHCEVVEGENSKK